MIYISEHLHMHHNSHLRCPGVCKAHGVVNCGRISSSEGPQETTRAVRAKNPAQIRPSSAKRPRYVGLFFF